MPDHQLDIQWCVAEHTQLPGEDLIRHWANVCLRELIDGDAEVCLRIVDVSEIRSINLTYRGRDEATNVISFPNDSLDENGRILLGDIVICQEVVATESKQQGKSVEAHFAHLLIHGILHLQGHDHFLDDQADRMERIEIDLMENLGYGNPYE
ncbi:MAG: rRNA maturation RNase YbeY [Gammaproteobacteria bacterium]|jgi:probable rRNA maturation factor|nr:rRNA maturation RNase YbeY [Gammaproteobacteria bacterium]|tara:strand:+ start:811 stop:1269 length:459 start_codon:yes stop_codon:yes gene_type:complete